MIRIAVAAAIGSLAFAASAQAGHAHVKRHAHRHAHRHVKRRIIGHEHAAPAPEPAPTHTTLTRPTLTAAQVAWIDAQTYPPELRRFIEDAVGYWGAVPDAPVVFRLTNCEQPGGEHSGGCEYADYGSGPCCAGPPVRYVIDLAPSGYPAPTELIPDPSFVGFAILVTHELGHANGHTHAEGGVMDGGNPYAFDQAYPFEQEVQSS